jgi:polyhydroxyalkanoate synthase
MTDVSTEAKPENKFDAEAFAMNVARAMESGGKALAAYLKPRENGEVKDKSTDEVAEVVKTRFRPHRATSALPIRNGNRTSSTIS